MDGQLDPLSLLAIRHGTDKFGLHDYTPEYHRLLAPLRNRPVRMLEIGVGGYSDPDRGGQSLATWRDYFPRGTITGLDIQPKALDLGPRIEIRQGSQVDPEVLARLVAERGPFDLILDDGSHRGEHVVESFRLLFPTLAPGGLYLVEDVQTAFMPRFGGSLDLAAPNTVGRFAAMIGVGELEVARLVRAHNVIAVQKAGAEAPLLEQATLTLPGDAAEGDLRSAWEALPLGSTLRVERPGSDIAALLRHLFAQVDHREIAQAHPGAAVDPMASTLLRMEVDADGATLWKAPNDYPSNFAFDPSHPRAARALGLMADALEGWDGEEGLVAYATLLTTLHGREAGAPWLARLDALGATSRAFRQMAGALARRERRPADARRHYAAGVERFPDDTILVEGLVGALLGDGKLAEAERAAEAALRRQPRVASLHLLMTRVADRKGDLDLAVEHARVAIALSGGARRAPALIAMGDALMRAGRREDAAAAFAAGTEMPGRHAARSWRGLSAARAALGLADEARAAAWRAVALDPREAAYRAWAERLEAAACPAEAEGVSLVA